MVEGQLAHLLVRRLGQALVAEPEARAPQPGHAVEGMTGPDRKWGAAVTDPTGTERWLPVPGYEGFYEVSNLGQVQSLGADFADGFTNELFVIGVFPTLLHQDPRYYRLGRGNAWKRTGYALSRILIGHGNSGNAEFNGSEFLGNFVSGALSMTYYPQSERTVGGVFTRMSVEIGYDSLFNILKEFYPYLKRKFRHH